jgi:hypothetical protein
MATREHSTTAPKSATVQPFGIDIGSAANDDMSPRRKAELWHQIIVQMTAVNESWGVLAWQIRLKGVDVFDYCLMVRDVLARLEAERENGVFMEAERESAKSAGSI